MHPHEELIARFYSAFQKRDGKGMAACYHPQVEFYDPVFQALEGDRAKAMWVMLCERAKDLSIEFSKVHADDSVGQAHWDAWYLFSTTGRTVHNIIDAHFEFEDGLIRKHIDSFDFHRWAGQALGLSGKLLGGTSFMQNKIRKTALSGLDAYLKKTGA